MGHETAVKDRKDTPGMQRTHTTDVDSMFRMLAEDSGVHEVSVAGLKLAVLPQVLSPRYSHAPDALISKWSIPEGGRILDLGCGCGVLGIAALEAGAGSLLALDINEHAVANALLNFERLGLAERATAKLSDVYSALAAEDVFDIIIFAAPYWNRPAETALERSCFDEGHAFFHAALSGARSRLVRNGRMFIIFSDQGDVSAAARSIEASGLSILNLHVFRPTSPNGHVRLIWELIADQSRS